MMALQIILGSNGQCVACRHRVMGIVDVPVDDVWCEAVVTAGEGQQA